MPNFKDKKSPISQFFAKANQNKNVSQITSPKNKDSKKFSKFIPKESIYNNTPNLQKRNIENLSSLDFNKIFIKKQKISRKKLDSKNKSDLKTIKSNSKEISNQSFDSKSSNIQKNVEKIQQKTKNESVKFKQQNSISIDVNHKKSFNNIQIKKNFSFINKKKNEEESYDIKNKQLKKKYSRNRRRSTIRNADLKLFSKKFAKQRFVNYISQEGNQTSSISRKINLKEFDKDEIIKKQNNIINDLSEKLLSVEKDKKLLAQKLEKILEKLKTLS